MFHNDKICPKEYRYNQYSTVEEAKLKCSRDETCGYVYDWYCQYSTDSSSSFELCKKFPATELAEATRDCVYEKNSYGKLSV